MRLVKRITAAAMALTMTAALAGCGSSSGSTSTTAAADTTAAAVTEKAADGSSAEAGSTSVSIDRAKEFVTVATGPTSGIYYPIGGAFATALGNAGYKTSAQATGASVENINLILNGESCHHSLFNQAQTYIKKRNRIGVFLLSDVIKSNG